MINHGRTLLLNRNGAMRPDPTFFLEEYVPADFAAQTLPQYLLGVQNVLIGEGADNAFANFRMWQYMRLIHATEFAAYLTDLDPRITYLTDRSVAQDAYLQVVSSLNPQASGTSVYPVGSVPFEVSTPRLQYEWTIEAVTPLLVRTSQVGSRESNEHVVTAANGLTDLIPLAGQSDLFVRIQFPFLVSSKWSLSTFSKPRSDVVDLLEPLSMLGNETFARLFGNTEPYKTFRDLWEKHFQIHYQLGGLLLAWIYRAEENRLNG